VIDVARSAEDEPAHGRTLADLGRGWDAAYGLETA
jgi:hypothetical protein